LSHGDPLPAANFPLQSRLTYTKTNPNSNPNPNRNKKAELLQRLPHDVPYNMGALKIFESP